LDLLPSCSVWAVAGAFELAAQPAMKKHFYGWCVQDDWKATRKLTLNLGLRHDMQTAAL